MYLGAGWNIVKDFSIGANVGFVWGDYSHTIQAAFNDNNVNQFRRVYSADISTYKIDFGAQYSKLLSKKDLMTVGASYTWPGITTTNGKWDLITLSSCGRTQNSRN